MSVIGRKLVPDRCGFGRIPFALVAVTILLTTTLLVGIIYEIALSRNNRDVENTFALIDAACDEGGRRFESAALRSLNEILIDISSTGELRDLSLNDRLHRLFNESLLLIFPLLNEAYTVDIKDHRLLVIVDDRRNVYRY